MSHTYHLLCVDTLEALDLGKFVCFDENGSPIPWLATGWLDQSDGHRIEGVELWRMVETFLILLRGKELRVVPDTVLHEIDPTGQAIHRIDTYGELLERHVDPSPDTVADLRVFPHEVTDRLRRACAAVVAAGTEKV